jgi:hypothetical protein
MLQWKDGAGNSGCTRVVGASVSSSGHQYTWDETFPFLASFLVDNATNVPLPRMLHLSVRQVSTTPHTLTQTTETCGPVPLASPHCCEAPVGPYCEGWVRGACSRVCPSLCVYR